MVKAVTTHYVRETIPEGAAEKRAGARPDHDDESFVKWIPIVVPLFAVFTAVLVYVIFAGVM